MEIEKLINKYFDGETTCEEEITIRTFFKQEKIPAEIEVYRDFFAYFNEERKELGTDKLIETPKYHARIKRIFKYTAISIAACLTLAVGLLGIYQHFDSPKSFVMIDGVCYTQKEIIWKEAINSLQQVSMDEDEVLQILFSEQ